MKFNTCLTILSVFVLPIVDYSLGSSDSLNESSTAANDHSGVRVAMTRLNRYLLDQGYNRYVRPVFNTSKVTEVMMRMSVHQIIDMKEVEESISLNVWLEFRWKDEFLTWNPYDFDGIKEVHLPSRKVWIPDILLYNSVDSTKDVATFYSYTDVLVYPDGSVIWYTPIITTSSCKQNPGLYPFDLQTCRMKYSSWTYSKKDIDMKPKFGHVVLYDLEEDGEWSVESSRCTRNEIIYGCCPDMPYVDLEFTIRLKRKPLFYLFNLLYPCGILVLTDSMVFFLPPASGEKITLAVTVLLAMMVFLTVIMQNMPSTSVVIPLLETFFGAMIALFALVTIEVVWVVNIYHRKSSNGRPPLWMRKFFNEKLRKTFRLPQIDEVFSLRRLSLVSRGDTVARKAQNGGDKVVINSTEKLENGDELPPAVCHAHQATDSVQDSGVDDVVADEWQMIAQVLDYVFFYVYVVFVVIVTFISFRKLVVQDKIEPL